MFNKKNKKVITIEGMSCNHCVQKIENTLNSIEGVKKVKINLKNKNATITTNKNVDDNIIKNKIENLDYKVIDIENK